MTMQTNPALTADEVRALLELWEKATPGPWEWEFQPMAYGDDDVMQGVWLKAPPLNEYIKHDHTVADVKFIMGHDARPIALSRNIAPRLAAEWLAMQKRIRELEAGQVRTTFYTAGRRKPRPYPFDEDER